MSRSTYARPVRGLWGVRHTATLGILGALAALSGCTSHLASVIVGAPNAANPFVAERYYLPPLENLTGVEEHFRVEVGPPKALLAVYIRQPRPLGRSPRGTILLLHGIFSRSLWMTGPAHRLSAAGYRIVMVDLRGQGSSTGQWITYGVQESQDLCQLIDVLDSRGLIAGKLGVYGFSFGASTAIHLAARDPRIAATVAVAPFGRMRDEVPHYARTVLPLPGLFFSDDAYQTAIDEAGMQAAFDPDLADAALAMPEVLSPVLLVHGASDQMVPSWQSERIHEAAPDRSRLILLPGQGHVSVWFDRGGTVASHAQQWFDTHLADAGVEPVGAVSSLP